MFRLSVKNGFGKSIIGCEKLGFHITSVYTGMINGSVNCTR